MTSKNESRKDYERRMPMYYHLNGSVCHDFVAEERKSANYSLRFFDSLDSL